MTDTADVAVRFMGLPADLQRQILELVATIDTMGEPARWKVIADLTNALQVTGVPSDIPEMATALAAVRDLMTVWSHPLVRKAL